MSQTGNRLLSHLLTRSRCRMVKSPDAGIIMRLPPVAAAAFLSIADKLTATRGIAMSDLFFDKLRKVAEPWSRLTR